MRASEVRGAAVRELPARNPAVADTPVAGETRGRAGHPAAFSGPSPGSRGIAVQPINQACGEWPRGPHLHTRAGNQLQNALTDSTS